MPKKKKRIKLVSWNVNGLRAVIKKDFFESLDGFPEWPFFEDVHLLNCARKMTKIRSLRGPAITSARRFLKGGLIRQQLFNGYLIIQYLLGVKPKELYEHYYH